MPPLQVSTNQFEILACALHFADVVDPKNTTDDVVKPDEHPLDQAIVGDALKSQDKSDIL